MIPAVRPLANASQEPIPLPPRNIPTSAAEAPTLALALVTRLRHDLLRPTDTTPRAAHTDRRGAEVAFSRPL